MSRVTTFGHGAGCDFVEKPCIGENDSIPEYSKGFFCNTPDRNVYSCDPTHRMIATCDLYDLSKVPNQNYPPIPLVMRQFDNPVSTSQISEIDVGNVLLLTEVDFV